MKGLQELRGALAGFLREHGLEAVTAWGPERRPRAGGPVAAVSLRGFESGPPGFQDYLGERYDEAKGGWEELYGKRVELTFGLDVYAASAQGVQAGLDILQEALGEKGPAGLYPVGLTVGETAFQSGSGRYCCPVQARFWVWAVAVSREDGAFLDFEVRGERV